MHIGPIYEMFKISLYAGYPVENHAAAGLTLESYAVFFRDSLYYQPLVRSFIFSIAATAATLVVVYPVAYYVAKIVRPEGRSRALLLLLVPFWAGEIIRTFSVIMLLANRGAVNALLREIGLIDRPIPMLYTSFSLGFGLVYLISLYMLLPLYSAIEKIPRPSARRRRRPRRRAVHALPQDHPAAVAGRDRIGLQPRLPYLHGRVRHAHPAWRAATRAVSRNDRRLLPRRQRQMAGRRGAFA